MNTASTLEDLLQPVTAPVPFVPEVVSLPSSSPRGDSQPMVETIVLRDGTTPRFEVHMRCQSSRRHALQDGADVAILPGGGAILTVCDATTNARGVAPEDATQVVMLRLQQAVRDAGARGRRPFPKALTRFVHGELRSWLRQTEGSSCGVAQSIAVLSGSGHLSTSSVGDTRVLVFRPGRLFRKARVDDLNPSSPDSEGRTLRSALGQSRPASLAIECSEAMLEVGDMLVMGSDGGLPQPHRRDLLDGLQAYAADRRRRLASLEGLGSDLEARAQRLGTYDDDRTLLIVERL